MARDLPKKWTVEPHTGAGKSITIRTDTRSGVKVWVDNDDVDAKDSAKVARSISKLPRLLMLERVVKEMFDSGQLDPYPTSDDSAEYALRKLTKWKRKEK